MAKNPLRKLHLPRVRLAEKDLPRISPDEDKAPFTLDPSNTQAFAALGTSEVLGGAQGAAVGPLRAVVIGGGTGAPMSIRSLLSLGLETSAVVAMADDGGSTGLLREEAGVTPPGDIRKCIAAMAASPDDPLTRAFRYRFACARNHTLGNLMLCALEDAAGGFPEAIAICERLLDARGHVYPSTLDWVTLHAVTRDGRTLDGQAIASHSKTALSKVSLQRSEPGETEISAYGPAVDAILNAQLIVLGPGSLFTSIIPNLLVPGIVDAIRRSAGNVVFVCSLADVQGETWGLTAKEHYDALCAHGMEGLVDYMIVHSLKTPKPDRTISMPYRSAVGRGGALDAPSEIEVETLANGQKAVSITYADINAIQQRGTVVMVRDLSDPNRPTWHRPQALQEALKGVLGLCRLPQM